MADRPLSSSKREENIPSRKSGESQDPGDSATIFGFESPDVSYSAAEISEIIGPFPDCLGVVGKFGQVNSALNIARALILLTPGENHVFNESAVVGLNDRFQYLILENEGALAIKHENRWVYPMPGRSNSIIPDFSWIKILGCEIQLPPPVVAKHQSPAEIALRLPADLIQRSIGVDAFESPKDQLVARLNEIPTLARALEVDFPDLSSRPKKVFICNGASLMITGTPDHIMVSPRNDIPVEFFDKNRDWTHLPRGMSTMLSWGIVLRCGGPGGEIFKISR